MVPAVEGARTFGRFFGNDVLPADRRSSLHRRTNGVRETRRTSMPQYAALIYTRDADWTSPDEAETSAAYGVFGAEHGEKHIRGGAALFPTSTATTIRVKGGRGGEVVTSDGPYVETKEVLGGFYL